MANVLILGGAGFIGSHLTRYLSESGEHRVTIVDNLSRGRLDDDLKALLDLHDSIDLKIGDLTDANFYQSLSEKYDHVYILAGILGVQNVQDDPAKVLRVNTSIINNSFNWLAGAKCGRVLFASTSEAYGGSVDMGLAPVPTGESVPLAFRDIQQPRSTYGLTKTLGESFLTHYANEYGFEGVAVRFHNVYGPRMGFSHVIPQFIERVHKQLDPMPVYGLEDTRAFCYVRDAVRACAALMQCGLERPEIVNVGNDNQEVTIGALLNEVLDTADFHPRVEDNPTAVGGVRRRCPDISKLRALTGFAPEYDLRRGITETWEWYKSYLDCRTNVDVSQTVKEPA